LENLRRNEGTRSLDARVFEMLESIFVGEGGHVVGAGWVVKERVFLLCLLDEGG